MHTPRNVQDPCPSLHGIETCDTRMTRSYRYWRMRMMYSLIIGYAAFYLVRLNFAIALPIMLVQFDYTKQQFGWIFTLSSIIYGVGKFVHGYVADRVNARIFISVALAGTALMNFCMAMGGSLLFFTCIWSLNSWFQSMAWPPISKLLTHWYSPQELGTKWGLWSSSHQIGGAAIFVLAAYLIQNHGWQSAFFVPASIALMMSFFTFDRLRDTPQSMGLPAVEAYKKESSPARPAEKESISHKELLHRVFTNKLLWYVCFGNLFLYIVRVGVTTWASSFLKEMKGSCLLLSGWQIAVFEIGGLLGGIAAGWLSDHAFRGRRGPVSVIYMLGLALALLAFWTAPVGAPWLSTALMFGVGFMVYGPQVLVGVAAADFASKKAVGLATGLAGTMGALGGAISGVGVGWISDHYGWDGGFIFFMASALLGAAMFALTWRHSAATAQR